MQEENNEKKESGAKGVSLEQLRQLFAAFSNIKFRAGSTTTTKYQMVAFIDARDAMNRLDKVCGPMNWKQRFYEVSERVYCEVSIRCQVNGHSEWIGKSDCGSESNVEQEKGQASDAFKRACVHWGINRSAYSLPIVWLDKGSKKNYCKINGKELYISSDEVQAYCRKKAGIK
jgi:hypothetical protein